MKNQKFTTRKNTLKNIANVFAYMVSAYKPDTIAEHAHYLNLLNLYNKVARKLSVCSRKLESETLGVAISIDEFVAFQFFNEYFFEQIKQHPYIKAVFMEMYGTMHKRISAEIEAAKLHVEVSIG